jgi:hypothetical protein
MENLFQSAHPSVFSSSQNPVCGKLSEERTEKIRGYNMIDSSPTSDDVRNKT